MPLSLADFVVEAASSAFRGLGASQAVFVVRPTAEPTPQPRPGEAPPVRDLAFLKVEVNFNR